MNATAQATELANDRPADGLLGLAERGLLPDALLRPVVVTCRDGETSRALGECALAYRAGLNRANSQIAAIAVVIQ